MSRMLPVVFIALMLLPPTFKNKLPRNGLIMQVYGIVTPSTAYVVDFDSRTIRLYQSGMDTPPKMRKFVGSRKLDPKIISDIRALADQVIADNCPSPCPPPDMDFSAFLEVSKHGKITEIDPFGSVLDEKQPISVWLNLLSGQFSTKVSSDATR